MEISVMRGNARALHNRYRYSFDFPEEWQTETCIMLTGICLSEYDIEEFSLVYSNLRINNHSMFDEDMNILSKFTVPVIIYPTDMATWAECFAYRELTDLTITFQWCSASPEWPRYDYGVEVDGCRFRNCCFTEQNYWTSIHFQNVSDIVYIKAFSSNSEYEEFDEPLSADCIQLLEDDDSCEMVMLSPTVVRINGRYFHVTASSSNNFTVLKWLIVKTNKNV